MKPSEEKYVENIGILTQLNWFVSQTKLPLPFKLANCGFPLNEGGKSGNHKVLIDKFAVLQSDNVTEQHKLHFNVDS